MKKSALKALFINAKATGAKYIGVEIKTEGSSRSEVIINPRENFEEKYQYYMNKYDEDLTLISAKGERDIVITNAAQGYSFEDIQSQLFTDGGSEWKKLIADAIDAAYEKMISETPPESEKERVYCEAIREGVKGMFISASRTVAEARFITAHIEDYKHLFDICMNGDELQFKKGLVEIQKMQNEYILRGEGEKS